MKVLLFALLFTCIIYIGHALISPQYNSCSVDEECKLSIGPNCFCLKPYRHHLLTDNGSCICNMDPNILNPPAGCFTDDECKSKAVGFQYCGCVKEKNKQTGECKCINPLYG